MSKMGPRPLPRENPRIWFLHPWKILAAKSLRPPRPRSREPRLARGNDVLASAKSGGASRDRTDDLKLAKLALSQLSYGPTKKVMGTSSRHLRQLALPTMSSMGAMVGREGVEPSTSRLSGVRSNHLSYRPPCHADHEAAGGVSQLRLHFPTPVSWLGKRFQDEGT